MGHVFQKTTSVRSVVNAACAVLAFGIGLALAWYHEWRAVDLIWSLWLSSLVTGGLTFLMAAFALGFGFAALVIMEPSLSLLKRGGICFAIFMIMSIYIGVSFLHYGFAHYVQAIFLAVFFPLPQEIADGYSFSFFGWLGIVAGLLPVYGGFLLAAIIAERSHIFFLPWEILREFRLHQQRYREDPNYDTESTGPKISMDGKYFSRPYQNVIRMQMLIFVFAACHFFKVEHIFVFALVYAVYFFPWEILPPKKSPSPRGEGDSSVAIERKGKHT